MKSDFVGCGRERSRGRGRWVCVAWHGFIFDPEELDEMHLMRLVFGMIYFQPRIAR